MKRVYLRELMESDINEDYLKGFSDDDVLNFLEVDGKNLTKDAVVEYIREGRENKSYYMYAVCLLDSDKHIGNLKIGPINWKHMFSDLVTVIWDKQYWGKGLATDAIKEGNKLAFDKYNIRKLTGGMYANNMGSIKAYTKSGWIIEGKLQNHFIENGKFVDYVLVSCFNPCFDQDNII
jgi:[ribosomal protein S5]-alanine N-acetyltransferase